MLDVHLQILIKQRITCLGTQMDTWYAFRVNSIYASLPSIAMQGTHEQQPVTSTAFATALPADLAK